MALPEYDAARLALQQNTQIANQQNRTAIQRKFAQLGNDGTNQDLQNRIGDVAEQNMNIQNEIAGNSINAAEIAAQRKMDQLNTARAQQAAETLAQNQFAKNERENNQAFANKNLYDQAEFAKALAGQELDFNQSKFNQNLATAQDQFNRQFALDKSISEFNKNISSQEMQAQNTALFNSIFYNIPIPPAPPASSSNGSNAPIGISPTPEPPIMNSAGNGFVNLPAPSDIPGSNNTRPIGSLDQGVTNLENLSPAMQASIINQINLARQNVRGGLGGIPAAPMALPPGFYSNGTNQVQFGIGRR